MVSLQRYKWAAEHVEKTKRLLASFEHKSAYRYSLHGDIISHVPGAGLAPAVYAIKLAYILDMKEYLDMRSDRLSEFLLSFEHEGGYLYDPYLRFGSLPLRILVSIKNAKWSSHLPTVRAETRQTLSALRILGHTRVPPHQEVIASVEATNDFIAALDWDRPWHAGSHLSHLLFFLNASRQDAHKQQEHILAFLKDIQKPDGCWYATRTSDQQKINGAMKVLTGLSIIDRTDIIDAQALIDTCITLSNNAHACDNFNIVYVLSHCVRHAPNYRTEEIRGFLDERLDLYRKYSFEQGGFSFRQGRANMLLYNAPVSTGRNCPDIHGTLMFIWGLSLIEQMIPELELGLRPHEP